MPYSVAELQAVADRVRAAFAQLDTLTVGNFVPAVTEGRSACIELVDRVTLRAYQRRAWDRAVVLDAPTDDIRCQLTVKMQREQLAVEEANDAVAVERLRAVYDTVSHAVQDPMDRWLEDLGDATFKLAGALARSGNYEEATNLFDRAAEAYAGAAEHLERARPGLVAHARARANEVRLVWDVISRVRDDVGLSVVEAIVPLPPLPPALPGVPQLEFKRDN